MPSPFPGMNPYLEQDDAWRDFQKRFIPALGEALSPQLSPKYIVDYIYPGAPNPPFAEADAAWASDLLKVQSSAE